MKSRIFNTAVRNSKRFISVILSIIMVLSFVPLSIFQASAAEPVTLGAPLANNDYSQIRAMKNGWIAGSVEFQNPVDLKINKVYSGTKMGAFDAALVSDDPDSPVPIYYNHLVEQYNNPTRSQAVVYVDPDVTPNLLNSGVQIELNIPGTTAISSYARWGVEITNSAPGYSSAVINEAYNNATITTQKGKSISYFLSDVNGTQINSGSPLGTLNGDWLITKYASYGPYHYYLNGSVPEAGDRATIRVYGACGTWAMNNFANYQWMSVYIDLTVISVSKTALKNAIGAHVKTAGASADKISAYNTALANAVTVYNKPNAEQTEVDQATNALNAAINALGRCVNVTFDGQSATTIQTLNLLAECNKPMPTIVPPTRLGYTFDGFYTGPNKSGTKYYNADGTSARNMDLTQNDVTLYAGWTINSYTLKFDADGGNQVFNKTYNINGTSTLPTCRRTGSAFTGWKVITGEGNWTVGSTVAAGTSLNGKYGNATFKAQWSAIDYTSKVYDEEFYYPSGTQFIQYLAVAADVHSADAKNRLTNGGYTVINYNLNAGKSDTATKTYDAIYMGYKTTDDISKALRDIGFVCDLSSKPENVTYRSCTYKRVGVTDVTDTARVDGAKDLNSSAGGSYIYAYATRDFSAGTPITNLYFNSTGTSISPIRTGVWIDSDDLMNITEPADLNKGAGGQYVYAHFNGPTGWTQIDSTELRQTMTQVSALLQNYSVYTDSSVASLRADLSSAITCYEDLQEYGASTYSQTSINDLNANLISKMDALKTEIALNPNGGTIDGSTEIKTVTYTVGSYTPSFTFPVSDYTPTKDYYDFLGWSTESTATSGNKNEVTLQLANRTIYAIFAPTTYSINYNLNGGTATNPTSYNVETATFTLNNPTRTGYTFTGWTGSNGSTAQTSVSIAKGSTGNKSYTANWNVINYTIGYNLNGGTATNPDGYNIETATFTLNDPTRTGYTFTGWTGSNGATPQTTVSIVKGSTGNRDYTANWMLDPYSITYYLDGGEAENPDFYNVETPTFTLNNPTKTGYTFAGWTGSNGTTPQTTVTIAKGSTGNKAYTANWNVINYTINYTLNGGTATNPTSYNIETATFTLNNPTRTGYNFTGWTGSNGSTAQTSVSIAKGSTGNKSYTANWTTQPYTLSYELNGGSATNPDGYNVETATFTLNNPTKTGYTFVGWTGSNGTEKQTTVTIAQGSTGNKSYTASYTANTYTVAYNGNGNTGGSTANSTHKYDTASNLTANGFTKTGFTFAGWATSANGAVEYENSESVTNLTSTNGVTVTLYAQWTKDVYSITYKLNGGSATNNTTYDVETATFTLNNPDKTGYTFTGWSGTEIDGTSMAVTIEQGSAGNREYTANWTGNAYTVTFDANSGTGTMASQAFTYGTSQSLTANSFQKEGYYFAGWSTSPDGNVVYGDKKSVSNLTPEVNGEVTLYAVWKLTPEFEVAIPDYCGEVNLSKHQDLEKYNIATVTAPMIKGGKYFVYWIATYNDGTTEIASTYRSYSFFVTRDVSLEPFYVATQNEYNTERAKALIVSRVTGFEVNEDGSAILLAEHSVSPSAIGNQTGIIGHGVVYTANEQFKDNLNIDIENDEVFDKIARTSKDNLSGLLEVNVGNATKVWAVPYVILKTGEVRYGTMKELNASQTFTVDEAMMTNSVMSFDLTSLNEDADELTIEETQPTVDEEFSQPTFIEKLIKIVTTIVENFVAIIKRLGAIK